jgi:hypothetical protein
MLIVDMMRRKQEKVLAMRTVEQIRNEIEALKQLAAQYPHDVAAQASLAGQINALLWVARIVSSPNTSRP